MIDADELARKAVGARTAALGAIVELFGEDVLRDDGTLDRKKVAAAIFNDDAQRRALNAIVHPEVTRLTFEAATALRDAGEALACYEAALIIENGVAEAFRPLVVVSAPEEIQVTRATKRDGSTPEEALARIRSQMPLAEKVAVADYVIDNTGSIGDLERRTDVVLADICKRLNVDVARYP